jgi:hypothetical protein
MLSLVLFGRLLEMVASGSLHKKVAAIENRSCACRPGAIAGCYGQLGRWGSLRASASRVEVASEMQTRQETRPLDWISVCKDSAD